MQTASLSVVIAVLFIFSVVLAQSFSSKVQPQSSFAERFHAADANGDRALTWEEAKIGKMASIAKRFEEIDADKDDRVTLEEFFSYLKRHLRAGPMV